jgi:uncharacterized protein
MQARGHHILFTAREKEHELYLLKTYGFEYKSFGNHYKSKIGKVVGLFRFNIKMFITALSFKPDLFLSHGSIYAAQIAWLIGRPHISLEDSGNMEQIRLYRPFTKVIISPDILPENLGIKHIRYRSYHELAYLHPDYFKADDSIYSQLKILKSDKFCILRFISWKATHDKGNFGLSYEQKMYLVTLLSRHFKVFISSEAELSAELKEYKIPIKPEKMHDALYYASLFVGEGATMASEAGILGTTSVYINSIRRSYCEDQERFGLVYTFQDSDKAIKKIEEIIAKCENLGKQIKSREALLQEKISLTDFLVWFVENYPGSFTAMKENPDYQFNFFK